MIGLALAVALAGAAQTSDANPLVADPERLHQIDQHFRCPETLKGRGEKLRELERFDEQIGEAVEDLTPARLMEVRVYLLRKHHCAATLRNLRSSGAVQ